MIDAGTSVGSCAFGMYGTVYGIARALWSDRQRPTQGKPGTKHGNENERTRPLSNSGGRQAGRQAPPVPDAVF